MKLILIVFLTLGAYLVHAAELYELKGDRLGMELNDFKSKHKRSVSGHDETIPWCSDALPKQEINTLLSEVYFTDANMVNCRITFPFEDREFGATTIAGISTKNLIYHFIDNKLFKITALLPQNGFYKLKQSLIKKYGKPHTSVAQNYQNRMGAIFTGEKIIWENNLSKILFIEHSFILNISELYFVHNKLNMIAKKRIPEPSIDDL